MWVSGSALLRGLEEEGEDGAVILRQCSPVLRAVSTVTVPVSVHQTRAFGAWHTGLWGSVVFRSRRPLMASRSPGRLLGQSRHPEKQAGKLGAPCSVAPSSGGEGRL